MVFLVVGRVGAHGRGGGGARGGDGGGAHGPLVVVPVVVALVVVVAFHFPNCIPNYLTQKRGLWILMLCLATVAVVVIKKNTQIFHYSNFETSTLNDLKWPLNITRSNLSNLYVIIVPVSQILLRFNLRSTITGYCVESVLNDNGIEYYTNKGIQHLCN